MLELALEADAVDATESEPLISRLPVHRISYAPLGRKIMFRAAAVQEYLNKLEVPA